MKLLGFSPQMEWEELKLFEREAEVLQALNHPRIPRYRDYFDIDKETGGGVPWFWVGTRLYSRCFPSGIIRTS